MSSRLATCGHDITAYPWDWPAVWTKGWHDADLWAFETLCFPCIQEVMKARCPIQFSAPDEVIGEPHA